MWLHLRVQVNRARATWIGERAQHGPMGVHLQRPRLQGLLVYNVVARVSTD